MHRCIKKGNRISATLSMRFPLYFHSFSIQKSLHRFEPHTYAHPCTYPGSSQQLNLTDKRFILELKNSHDLLVDGSHYHFLLTNLLCHNGHMSQLKSRQHTEKREIKRRKSKKKINSLNSICATKRCDCFCVISD